MKKRNGQVAEPYGREVISERVFDLLLKDVAYKLSFDYAHTLWNTWRQLVDDVFAEMDSFVDETVKFGTLLKFIKDDTQASENIDRRMEETFSKLDENIETIQRQTDERFNKILYPVVISEATPALIAPPINVPTPGINLSSPPANAFPKFEMTIFPISALEMLAIFSIP